MKRRPFSATTAIGATALLAAATLSACGAGGSTDGGVLRIGTSGQVDSLNPFTGINQDDYAIWQYMYPHLLDYDTTDAAYPYAPNLATSWTVSPDGKTVSFQLRKDAKWSDGQPLDASDVAWNLNLIKKFADGTLSGQAKLVEDMASITTPNPQILTIVYKQPLGTALYDLATTVILPPQTWQQYAGGDGKALKTFTNEPASGKPVVCGGPFILSSYRKNDIALFKVNPNWYGTKPKISGFGLQYYTSEDGMVTALRNGNIDAIEQVPPTSFSQLQKSSGIEVFSGPSLSFRDLIINSNPKKPKNRELLNPTVRMAMEYAINRQQIVNTAWLGHATPGSTIVAPGDATGGIQWHNSSISPLPYDPAKANQLLDSAGFHKGSDGTRVADGHPMNYTVIFSSDEAGAGNRAFQIVQAGLAAVGIKVSQKTLDSSASFDAIYCGDDCQYRDFDLAMWDWFPAADPDFILAAMTCDQWADWNDTGYCSDAYDALYAKQRITTDPKARKTVIDQMQKMIYDERPYIVLTYDQRLDAWSKKWTGFVESTEGFFNNFSVQSLISAHRA